MSAEDRGDIVLQESESFQTVTAVRAFILDYERRVLFVRYNATEWHGLPGGKVKEGEESGNLIGRAAFTALFREVKEETGVDLRPVQDKAGLFGLDEVWSVDSIKKQIRYILTPIFLFYVPKKYGEILEPAMSHESAVSRKVDQLNFPLFPDARNAVSIYQRRAPLGRFMADRKLYFQLHPEPGYLLGKPEWADY